MRGERREKEVSGIPKSWVRLEVGIRYTFNASSVAQ